MKEMLYCNDVVIQGTIVHKFKNDKVTMLTLSTGRNDANVINYPRIVFFNDSGVDVDAFDVYDNVQITGNVQSSFRRDGERQRISQSIYGESIKETARVMEEAFGIKEGSYERPVNKVKLAGEVIAVSEPSKNVVRILMKTIKNGRVSNVQMFDFTNKAAQMMEEVKTGDNICVLANVQTTKKTRDGEIAYYENIVVQHLVKVEN